MTAAETVELIQAGEIEKAEFKVGAIFGRLVCLHKFGDMVPKTSMYVYEAKEKKIKALHLAADVTIYTDALLIGSSRHRAACAGGSSPPFPENS